MQTTPETAPPNAAAAQPHPLTLRPQGLADRLGVSRRHVYKLLQHPDPAVRLSAPFKIGRATFWRIADTSRTSRTSSEQFDGIIPRRMKQMSWPELHAFLAHIYDGYKADIWVAGFQDIGSAACAD